MREWLKIAQAEKSHKKILVCVVHRHCLRKNEEVCCFLETGRSAAHMLDEHNPVVSSLEVKTSFFADVLDVLKIFSFSLAFWRSAVLCGG